MSKIDRGKRPSPHESATLFEVGTVKEGQDGNQWKVIETSDGKKRWAKVHKFDNGGEVEEVELDEERDEDRFASDDDEIGDDQVYGEISKDKVFGGKAPFWMPDNMELQGVKMELVFLRPYYKVPNVEVIDYTPEEVTEQLTEDEIGELPALPEDVKQDEVAVIGDSIEDETPVTEEELNELEATQAEADLIEAEESVTPVLETPVATEEVTPVAEEIIETPAGEIIETPVATEVEETPVVEITPETEIIADTDEGETIIPHVNPSAELVEESAAETPEFKRGGFIDAQEMKKKTPKTFFAPTDADLNKIKKGYLVKVSTGGERFWVKVTEIKGNIIKGKIDNTLAPTKHGLKLGDTITFLKKNVYNIDDNKDKVIKGGKITLADLGKKVSEYVSVEEPYAKYSVYECGKKGFVVSVAEHMYAKDNFINKSFTTKKAADDKAKKLAEKHSPEGFDTKRFAEGGSIPNGYKGKTAEKVWFEWDKTQRSHFIHDHCSAKAMGLFANQKEKDWKDVSPILKKFIEQHVREGQYAKGGEIKESYTKDEAFKTEAYTQEGINKCSIHGYVYFWDSDGKQWVLEKDKAGDPVIKSGKIEIEPIEFDLNEYGGGGVIEAKDVEDKWDSWTPEQRAHFIKDHDTKKYIDIKSVVDKNFDSIKDGKLQTNISDRKDLPEGERNVPTINLIAFYVKGHLDEGSYGGGGVIEAPTKSELYLARIKHMIAKSDYLLSIKDLNDEQIETIWAEYIKEVKTHSGTLSDVRKHILEKHEDIKHSSLIELLYLFKHHFHYIANGAKYLKGGKLESAKKPTKENKNKKFWVGEYDKHAEVIRKKAVSLGALKEGERLNDEALEKVKNLGGVWNRRVFLIKKTKRYCSGGKI